jgi:hypothetical protein
VTGTFSRKNGTYFIHESLKLPKSGIPGSEACAERSEVTPPGARMADMHQIVSKVLKIYLSSCF